VPHYYLGIFWQLIRTPFQHIDLVWGIVPLYFGWLTNELTSSKASFKTAIQTGFSFLWAGAHWSHQYFTGRSAVSFQAIFSAAGIVNLLVTVLVLIIGAVALVSGFRRRFPRHCSFLGHTRFGNYFMIAIFPIQSHYLQWSWSRLFAILIFAVPTWVIVELGMVILRRKG
jgi:hypothetical protein